MKKIVMGFMIIIISVSNIIGFAEEDLKGWKYCKEIYTSDEVEYKSFFIDEEMYRKGNSDLSHIRIINDQNEFVPYYIFNAYSRSKEEVNIEYDAKKILSFMKDYDQYTDFQVISKEDHMDVLGNKLTFKMNQDHFLKNIKIYGSYDNEKWDHIKTDHIYRTDVAEKLDIVLDDVYKYEYYRIVSINDVENTSIKSLKIAFNEKEVLYKNYKKTKKGDFKIDLQNKDTVIFLNNKDHLKIKDIKIISEDDFKRNYDVYYKDDDENFNKLDSGMVYQLELEKFKVKKNSISIDGFSDDFSTSDTIKIIIKNQDNQPINIKDIEISYYIDKLVFKDSGSKKYKVLFGHKQKYIKGPVYDIESYKNYIEKEKQEICTLSKIIERDETKVNEEDVHINHRLILNIVIVFISIFLVIVILKKSNFKDI